MSKIAKTAFEVKVSNRVFDATANITGKYLESSLPADCSAGMLCVRGTLVDNEGYTGVKNGNTWTMVPAASTDVANAPIYACNPYGVNELSDGNNVYKMGANTLGKHLPAGQLGTFTRIDFGSGDCHYRFGVGNLSTALSTNTYLTIDDGLLVPDDEAPSTPGTPYFKVLGTGNFTYGNWSDIGYVDVEAHIA